MKILEEVIEEGSKKYEEQRKYKGDNPLYKDEEGRYERYFKKDYQRFLEERIPRKFRSADLNNCSETVQEYFRQEKYQDIGLFLFGSFGTGKTYAVYALSKYMLATGKDVRVINLPRLLNLIRASFSKQEVQNSSGDSEYAFVKDMSAIEKLIGTDILIIDDIGAEKPSDWVAETLYHLINSRYENEKTTLFTSNLNLDSLADKIGDRIVSRIAEMCEGNIHEMTGKDRRKNLAILK